MISVHVDRFVLDRLPPPELQPDYLFDLPELLYPDRLNAASILIDGGDPAAPAVINDAGSWTRGAMRDLSDRIAHVLIEEEGLVPGNRVLLRGPNGAMLFACWLGVLKAGGIAVATMPILRPGEIATILARAEISHAIVDDRFLADFQTATQIAFPRYGIRSLLSYHGDAGGGALEARLESAVPIAAPVPTGRDDPALIAFTSGTTGKPKGCVHFHRDILASADSFARHVLKPAPGGRWLCSAPIAFTFGLGMQLIFPWRFGGAAVTIEQPGPAPLLDAVGRHEVTVLATAPTAYKAMLPMLSGADITSLATCVSAGEPLPAATWHAWRRATGLGIVDGIGATEMMHIFISAAGADIRPGTIGKAVPGYQACVLDSDGGPLPHGIGRLAVKGPTGCRYLDDDRQRDYVAGGWNLTGDTFRQDPDGYFHFVARSDDMIVSSGYNIAAPEVEDALHSHPAVAECAVIGVPCPERGHKVKAMVVLAKGFSPGPDLVATLQRHVQAAIAPFKYPREVEFVGALPRTATGKLQRFALKER